ncbi:hypothetical protein MKW92_000777 [Papaver armeniacum]|nr:hypothetical protein MKW92_000777 [Papaver armeniacum]
MEGQENAARAIGLLVRDPESVEHMIHAGVCSVFAKILKEGPMKVQSMVAWAVSKHSKYAVTSNHKSIHSIILENNDSNAGNNKNNNVNSNNNGKGHEDEEKTIAHPMGNQNPNQMQNVVANTMANNIITKSQSKPSSQGPQNKPPNPHHHTKSSNPIPKHTHNQQNINLAGTSIKGREFEDPVTKATMKAMTAKALWHLAKGNSAICESICESRALLFFVVVLEKGVDDVQYNSAMATSPTRT